MKRYRYELRNAQGERCCASDNPDFPRCGKCSPAATPAATEPRTAVAPAVEKRTLAQWREHIAHILSPRLEAPDGYRAARDARRMPEPTDDPTYDPYGVPPNSYELAIAARTAGKEKR